MKVNPEITSKRNQLLAKSASYEQEINHQVEEIKDKAISAGKYALVVGGVAFTGYILIKFAFNMLSSSNEAEKPTSKIIHIPSDQQANIMTTAAPKETSFIVKMIMSAIATFLLAIAKQKLTQFLEKIYAGEAEKDNKPAA